jgi:parallel beta-helix repeat protein
MPKKHAIILAILSILCFYTVSLTNFGFAASDPNGVIIVNPGQSIQTAINGANEGDTIIIENGIHHEWHILVNKTLTIIGRTMENTIIDGNGEADVIFQVTASNVVIENFTLQNAYNVSVQGTAIRVYRATSVKVNKVITRNNYCGIELRSSNFTKITRCQISNNTWGIYLRDKSLKNTFIGNTIANNKIGINIPDPKSQYNLFYHNNFITNDNHVSLLGGINYFDNGYPSDGNYWSGYTAQDLKHGPYQNETGSDGILDEPYANAPDKYPFAYPLTFIEIPIAGEHFQVVASTNSTLNSYEFNPQTKSLRLTLSGVDGTVGACRIAVPKKLLSCDQPNQWNITSSDKQLNYLSLEDEENTYFYFTFSQANRIVVEIKGTNIITEFTSMLALIVWFGITCIVYMLISKFGRRWKNAIPKTLAFKDYDVRAINPVLLYQCTSKTPFQKSSKLLVISIFSAKNTLRQTMSLTLMNLKLY